MKGVEVVTSRLRRGGGKGSGSGGGKGGGRSKKGGQPTQG